MVFRSDTAGWPGRRGGMTLSLGAAAEVVSARVLPFLAFAVACGGVVLFTSDRAMARTAAIVGMTLCMMVLVARGMVFWRRMRLQTLERNLQFLTGQDTAPCFSTDRTGRVGFQNDAARERFGHQDGRSLIAALQDHFASPASVLFRLQNRARTTGSSREDVVTRRGHTRLSVHRLGSSRFLWRLEEFHERSGTGRGAESMSLPMLVCNRAGVVLFSNEAMRRLVGGRPRTLDALFGVQPARAGEEVEVRTADGAQRAILAEVAGPAERREIYLLPSAGEAANSDRADFEHVPVALMKLAADGRLRGANRAARDIFGQADSGSDCFHELFEGLGRSVTEWVGDVVNERIPGGAEVLRLRRADVDLFYQITLRRTVEHGRPGVLAVLNDATALKTLEAQFVQSQKMQAIGQLAGGIAHDFNNLLTAISGHCDLLLLRHERNDPEYADLVQIHQNANRAASLVGQLLAFSRKQTLKPQRIDLQDVLSDLTHLLNRLVGERITLRLSHALDPGVIRADKRQLEQVIMNLVVNARDAMPDGGTIRIETEAVALDADFHRDHAVVPAGAYAVIRVSDTGCGMPPELLRKIFEPFFTTKRVGEGTGLGLSTAYGIVKQSGGYIFVDSEPGRGTVFHLYFPISAAPDLDETPMSPTVVARVARPREGGVVLLVEDEAPVRAFASRALRLRGYTVLEADCAESALRTLEDPTLDVDVFVTDVVMPGLDGPGWVRMALEARPDVRTIFMSGYAEDCLSETQARIPNSVFLPKPFSLTDLTETVRDQLR